jgi:hypothetical protein
MSWAADAAAAVHAAAEVGADLTLRDPAAGGSTRTYTDVHEHETVFRDFRADGSLATNITRSFNVPRLSGATKPTKGEHAAYDGNAAGVVAMVTQEAGLWLVGVG